MTSQPEVKLIGVYKVIPSEEEVEAARQLQCDDEYVKQEMSTIALFEIEIFNADHKFDAALFKQPHTDYVPSGDQYFDLNMDHELKLGYLTCKYSLSVDPIDNILKKWDWTIEKFTDPPTNQEIENYHLPGQTSFRMLFYLHFFDPTQPLETPYGNLQIPMVTDIPERLSFKKYIYWD